MPEPGLLQELWQAGGLALYALLVIAAASAGLVARESCSLALRQMQAPSTLPVLGALGAVAPLVGLLGTVMGLVRVFAAGVAPEAVAGGIAQALLTTQVGLVVAVPALLARQALLRWRERHVARQAVEVLA